MSIVVLSNQLFHKVARGDQGEKMSGFAVIGMMVAILGLMLLGVRMYEAYREYKLDHAFEEAQNKFLKFLRSLGVEGDPIEWTLNQTKAKRLIWVYNKNSLELVSKLGSGDNEVEISLQRFAECESIAMYSANFFYSSGRFNERSCHFYLDGYKEDKVSKDFNGNVLVKDLICLVEAQIYPNKEDAWKS